MGPVALGDKKFCRFGRISGNILVLQIFFPKFSLNAVALGSDNLIFYAENVNQIVFPFRVFSRVFTFQTIVVFHPQIDCFFFFCAAAAEASAIEEVGSGEIDLRNFGTDRERNLLCPCYFTVWRAFEFTWYLSMEGANGFCDTKQTKKCDKIA